MAPRLSRAIDPVYQSTQTMFAAASTYPPRQQHSCPILFCAATCQILTGCLWVGNRNMTLRKVQILKAQPLLRFDTCFSIEPLERTRIASYFYHHSSYLQVVSTLSFVSSRCLLATPLLERCVTRNAKLCWFCAAGEKRCCGLVLIIFPSSATARSLWPLSTMARMLSGSSTRTPRQTFRDYGSTL